jgi:hypothetical protein
MGRAMLFLVTGSFIIFGMISLGVFDRQASMNEMNVEYVMTAQARNNANSGIERALSQLSADPNWRTGLNSPQRYMFGGNFVDVRVVDSNTQGVTLPPGIVEIRSTGIMPNGVQATARAQVRSVSLLPEINGAMGIFTDNLDFNVAGSAFLITGNDTNPDGTAGPAGSIPGMAVNSQAAFDEVMGSLNASQQSRLQGDGATTPSLRLNSDMDGNALQDFVDLAIANADHIYTDHTASGEGSLGTPANPKVIVVEGTLTVQNATGAGIIVIKEGGSLDARGNFDNFQGLIIIQGRADMTRGNIHIVGAMLFGGANPSIEIDIDFRGNVNISYSSSVLNNLTSRIPATAGSSQQLIAIYD